MLFVCLPQQQIVNYSTTTGTKKVVGGNYNVLVHYKNASAPNPEGVILCNPFKWDILLFILIENLVVCVPSTKAK
jgi:hypothetical protein